MNPETPPLRPECARCKFFLPVYFGFGRCRRQFSPMAKMYSDAKDSDIYVHVTFSCEQYEVIPDQSKAML